MPQVPKNKPEPLPIKNNIGVRLATLRKAKGYSQASLAEAMGISTKQIADYEIGRVHLNDEMIIRFSLTLNTTADKLLGLKEIESESETDGPSLRFSRRMRDLDKLPEVKKKAILTIMDDLIRANS